MLHLCYIDGKNFWAQTHIRLGLGPKTTIKLRKKDEETLELEKKLQKQIASNDRYIKRLKNRLQKSQKTSKNGKRCASQI